MRVLDIHGLRTAAADSSLGSQAETVKEEATCGLEAAKKRCETLKELFSS